MRKFTTCALSLFALTAAAIHHSAAREVFRNKEDRERGRLTPKKQRRIDQIIQRADSTDGHARLEGPPPHPPHPTHPPPTHTHTPLRLFLPFRHSTALVHSTGPVRQRHRACRCASCRSWLLQSGGARARWFGLNPKAPAASARTTLARCQPCTPAIRLWRGRGCSCGVIFELCLGAQTIESRIKAAPPLRTSSVPAVACYESYI